MTLQTLDRAALILQALAKAGGDGMRLVEIQQLLGLCKPTAHRLLASLVQHGLAQQDPSTRRYLLGPAIHQLAQSAPRMTDELQQLCLPAVRRLAARSGQTALLLLRFGLETLCVERCGGTPRTRHIARVGLLRPLGMGAAGVSILGELDDENVSLVLRQVLPRIRRCPTGARRDLDSEISFTRQHGYAITRGSLIRGMMGIGVALRDRHGLPIGALGLLIPEQPLESANQIRAIRALQCERELAERAFATSSRASARAGRAN